MKLDILQHRNPFQIGEADLVKANITLYILQFLRIRCIGNIRLRTHQFHKPCKPCTALGIYFHKLYQFPDRGGKGRNIQGKGEQIDKSKLFPHNQQSAEADDCHLHNSNRCLNPGIEQSHCPVIAHLAVLEGFIGTVKLFIFGLFCCKSL